MIERRREDCQLLPQQSLISYDTFSAWPRAEYSNQLSQIEGTYEV